MLPPAHFPLLTSVNKNITLHINLKPKLSHLPNSALPRPDALAQPVAVETATTVAAGIVDGKGLLILWFENCHVIAGIIRDEVRSACPEYQLPQICYWRCFKS